MGCNCGSKATQFVWVYTDGAGRQRTYSTEIEAKAAKIRSGGVGSIRTEPKT
jgi:hypothetical protein